MRRFAIIGLLLAIVCFAPFPTAGAEARRDSELSSAQALRGGVDLYNAGRPEEALSRLRGFLVRYPESPLLPEAYLYLARIFRDGGHHQEALLYLDRIPPEQRGPEARLIKGAALVGAGQSESGVPLLLELQGEELSPADRRLRLAALAEGNSKLGRPLAALFFLRQSLPLAGPRETEVLLKEAHLLLRDRLNEAELAEAAFMFADTPLGEDARLQQALRAFARGEKETARTLAQGVVKSTVPFPYRRDAILLLDRLMGGSQAERSIGVILPLSGRYASFGELVRQGMEMAVQIHSGIGVNFLFTDSDGEPERSTRAVSEFAREQRVLAIVGPLTGGAAAAAAVRAQQEKIPLLSLSPRDGIPETGNYIFRSSLTPSAQVEALAAHAMGKMGITRFAILAPENRLGQEMGELFSREVQKRGGRVVVRQTYAEDATDFKSQVRQMQGVGQELPEAKTSAPPQLSFQAVFIPDSADRVALVAPQIAYYGMEGIQLLGINGWNSPELPRLAGRFVEGAVFVDGFFRGSSSPAVLDFVRLYREKYGEDPSILEAQGFDVANILLSLLDDPAVHTREDLRSALSRLVNFPAVTGAISFDSNGEARKDLFLLQILKGEIVQIN